MITRSSMIILIFLSLHAFCFSQTFSYSYQGNNLCGGITNITNTATTMVVTTSGPKPVAGTYYIVMQYYSPTSGSYTSFPRKAATITTTTTSFTITFSTSTMPSALISADVPLLIDIDQQSSVTPFEYYLYYPSGTSDKLSCAVVLPLTFVSFTTSSVGSYNKLEWVTASESNTSFFKVQRSTDGNNFVDHGIEPAANNSSSNLTYTFYTPKANSGTTYYYRICCVDLDGTLTYSTIKYVPGSGSGNPTDFCAYTYIEGPASFCTGTTSAVYKLHNSGPSSGVTWTPSPTNATITPGAYGGGRIVTVSATGGGSTTLTATSGCSANKTIYLAAPYVLVTIDNELYYSNYTRYYISANLLPGRVGTDYRWYKNGVYFGTGISQTFNVTQAEDCQYWEVRLTTDCGEKTWGYNFCFYDDGGGHRFVLSPVPATNILTISPNKSLKSAQTMDTQKSINEKYKIQIVDMVGNLKKEFRNVNLQNNYQIDVSTLQPGNYIIYILGTSEKIIEQIKISR